MGTIRTSINFDKNRVDKNVRLFLDKYGGLLQKVGIYGGCEPNILYTYDPKTDRGQTD